jgi:hypothetical protein
VEVMVVEDTTLIIMIDLVDRIIMIMVVEDSEVEVVLIEEVLICFGID